MTKRSTVTALIAFVAAGLLASYGFVVLTGRPDAAPSDNESRGIASQQRIGVMEEGIGGFEFRWQRGTQYLYDFRLVGSSRASLDSEGGEDQWVQGRMELEGKLSVLGYGTREGRAIVAMGLHDLSRHRFEIMGNDLIPDAGRSRAVFGDNQAFLELDSSGRLLKMHFRPDADSLFRHVIEVVALETQVIVGRGEAEWSVQQASSSGDALAHYRIASSSEHVVRLEMDRKHYSSLVAVKPGTPIDSQRVDSSHLITLDRDGHVKHQVGREAIRVVDSNGDPQLEVAVEFEKSLLEVRSVEVSPFTAEQWAALEDRAAGNAASQELARRNALRQQVGGMTPARMRRDILKFGNAGQMPDHDRWAFRVVALLLFQPEAAQTLVDVYHQAGQGPRTLALILDLLANAGTAESQVALRQVLGEAATQSDPSFTRLVQSLLLLEHPEPSMAHFLKSTYQSVNGVSRRLAVANALGAVVRRLGESGQSDEASHYGAFLEQELDAASSPHEVQALLRALGNAALEEMTPKIVAHLNDKEAENRRLAVRALRRVKTTSSHSALVSMLDDQDAMVQGEALKSLSEHGYEASDMNRIADLIDSGVLRGRTLGVFARTLAQYPDPPAGTLEAMKAAASGDMSNQKMRRYIDSVLTRVAQQD